MHVKKIALFFILFLIGLNVSTIFAQTPKIRLKHGLRAENHSFQTQLRTFPTYNLIALQVEFQPDTTRFSSGDGTFSSAIYDTLTPKIDPLPHDASYFQAHLEFLEDYVQKVSGGKSQVNTFLVPEIIRVSKKMGAYAPTGESYQDERELTKLVELIKEAWSLANVQSGFDASAFSEENTAFVLFHAGSGRDVELVGSTLDKTPEDIPSLFFGNDALKNYLSDDIFFKGLKVSNTAIIPETESRIGYNFISQEQFLLELSINGLLAASFFNYFGVPDLFNTKTGETAIGGFGLMDAEGIFAFNGLFPPEPTAWTKKFLGWLEPEVITRNTPSTYLLQANQQRAYQIPISSSEYFLVENRNRDLNGNGVVLTIWKDGTYLNQYIQNNQQDFNHFNQEGFLGGVVVGVDHYDFALPGGIDCNGNPAIGGALIWHIDEGILSRTIGSNEVNANPYARGVDLEEADMAQDIGFDNSSGRGTAYDFFYKGNPPECFVDSDGTPIGRYENRFTPTSYPNSNSNSGGYTGISLTNFSDAGASMTFDYAREESNGIKKIPTNLTLEGYFGENGYIKSVENNWTTQNGVSNTIYIRGGNENSEISEGSFVVSETGEISEVSVTSSPNLSAKMLVSYQQNTWEVVLSGDKFSVCDDQNICLIDTILTTGSTINFISPLINLSTTDEALNIFFVRNGEGEGILYHFDGNTLEQSSYPEIVSLAKGNSQELALVTNTYTKLKDSTAKWEGYEIPDGTSVGQAVFGSDRGGDIGVIPVISEKKLIWLLSDGSISQVDLHQKLRGEIGILNAFPVLVDIDKDNFLDAVFTIGNKLVALSQGGAILEGFPKKLESESVTQPLVGKFSGEEEWKIFVATNLGNIYVFSRETDVQPTGFPLSAGKSIATTPLLQDKFIFVITTDGQLNIWQLENLEDIWWGELYQNEGNHSFVQYSIETPINPSISNLLVAAETYNWPNPIKKGQTNLRFQVTEPVTVAIQIFDLSGFLVDEIPIHRVNDTVPNEITWEAKVPSGIYVAVIVASTLDGTREESLLIKMAVIK